MPTEITILFLAAILLLVHIFAAGDAKTKQYGIEWNMGPRDDVLPPLAARGGRLVRAQANIAETLPIAIIALLGAVVAGRTNNWTAIGGWVWLGARIVYLPLYVMGIPKLRSAVYLVSLAGLLLVMGAALLA